MRVRIDRIASSADDLGASDRPFTDQDSIATESQQAESPAWAECIDALLRVFSECSALDSDDPRPNHVATRAALAWIAYLRNQFPQEPPTYIVPEPDGGLIVERRVTLPTREDCLCELTFYNDGHAERTDYVNGRIREINPIPQHPLDRDE
ncbi:MAG: hypothetical protein ACQESR_20755 [Planctomycetota bacterium]